VVVSTKKHWHIGCDSGAASRDVKRRYECLTGTFVRHLYEVSVDNLAARRALHGGAVTCRKWRSNAQSMPLIPRQKLVIKLQAFDPRVTKRVRPLNPYSAEDSPSCAILTPIEIAALGTTSAPTLAVHDLVHINTTLGLAKFTAQNIFFLACGNAAHGARAARVGISNVHLAIV
jgi:hypothetical protein